MRAYIVASMLLVVVIEVSEAGPRYTITDPEAGEQVDATKHRGRLKAPAAPRAPRVADRDRKLEIEIEQKGNWRTRMYREHWLRDPLPRRPRARFHIRQPNWSPPTPSPQYKGKPRYTVEDPITGRQVDAWGRPDGEEIILPRIRQVTPRDERDR